MAISKSKDVEEGDTDEHEHDWSGGLFSSCDGQLCCMAVFCPCCFFTTVLQKLQPIELPCCTVDWILGSVIMGICWALSMGEYHLLPFVIFTIMVAKSVMDKYGIIENPWVTCLKACCCSVCFLMQMYNEALLNDDEDPMTAMVKESRKQKKETLPSQTSSPLPEMCSAFSVKTPRIPMTPNTNRPRPPMKPLANYDHCTASASSDCAPMQVTPVADENYATRIDVPHRPLAPKTNRPHPRVRCFLLSEP